ncbi:MAG TPA: WGR domain-containing protein, partial [Kofleriaceae bacterium]
MRRFEYGGSKFWELETTGKEIRLRFGKLGANGQLKLQTYGSPAEATAAAEKQIAGKLKEGYLEIGEVVVKRGDTTVVRVTTAKKTPYRRPLGWDSAGTKPTTLKIKPASGTAKGVHRMAIVEAGGQPALIAAGGQCYGTTNGSKFHRRPEAPGLSYGLFAVDNILYSMGGPLMTSTDAGASWKKLKAPYDGYIFTLLRDSKNTYWLGCDEGAVFTATKPGAWTKAKFKAPGKVMAFAEIDGKIFVVGAGCGVWDGKKFTPLAGMKKGETITRIVEGPKGGLSMVGDGGIAYFSGDRGKTWKKVKSGVDNDLEDLGWVAGSLFAVGGGWGSGLVLRSDDEGKTWKNVGKTESKVWAIETWGDGAALGGEGGISLLVLPTDTFWKGKKDTFEPPPPSVDAQFAPLAARSDKELTSKFDKLYAQAIADHERISAKQRASRTADTNAKLAAAVDEGADGAEAIYADWLTDSGDPRGELAQIQLRLAKDPKNKELKKSEKALLKQHAAEWLGKLAGLEDVVDLEWTAGFISKARIANTYDREGMYGEETKREPIDVEKLVDEVLSMPSGRFLRDLTVGIVEFEENDYAGVA